MLLIHSLAALGAAYLVAASFYLALGLKARARLAVGAVLAFGLGLTPLMVPPGAPVTRLAVAIVIAVFALKMWDLHLGVERGHRPGLAEVLAFLPNIAFLVHRRKGAQRQPDRRSNLGGLLRALLVAGAAYWILMRLLGIDWSGVPFLAEHGAKATTFFVFATALFEVTVAVMRALGGYGVDPVDRPLRSRTPAEFWRRYNRIVGEFLREDVFRQAGGRRRPVRATLVVFAVSGLVHEYIFTMATGELQGYQTAFFLVQGCAVALTLRARPSPMVGIPATFAFNLVSSILFFASFAGMARFYQDGLPGWLWG